MEAEVISVFHAHKARYGSRRLKEELKDRGFEVGRDRIRSIMRAHKLVAIQPKSFVPKTTRDDPSKARSPNLLLEREPLCQDVCELIVGDITYWPLKSSWIYLSVWMDLFSRKIVGWALEDHMRAELIEKAFEKVLLQGRVHAGTIVHSDGGAQYKAHSFRSILSSNQCSQSMTRKDNHYDNAFIESLFSRIKAEMMAEKAVFENIGQARGEIFQYIEAYYNTIRRHSSIGYLSPSNFENRCLKLKKNLR